MSKKIDKVQEFINSDKTASEYVEADFQRTFGFDDEPDVVQAKYSPRPEDMEEFRREYREKIKETLAGNWELFNSRWNSEDDSSDLGEYSYIVPESGFYSARVQDEETQELFEQVLEKTEQDKEELFEELFNNLNLEVKTEYGFGEPDEKWVIFDSLSIPKYEEDRLDDIFIDDDYTLIELIEGKGYFTYDDIQEITEELELENAYIQIEEGRDYVFYYLDEGNVYFVVSDSEVRRYLEDKLQSKE